MCMIWAKCARVVEVLWITDHFRPWCGHLWYSIHIDTFLSVCSVCQMYNCALISANLVSMFVHAVEPQCGLSHVWPCIATQDSVGQTVSWVEKRKLHGNSLISETI